MKERGEAGRKAEKNVELSKHQLKKKKWSIHDWANLRPRRKILCLTLSGWPGFRGWIF